ncbi:hypothetical protein RB195_005117 [Necator americanus]
MAGIFGHSVILYATYKTKEIQTKYGLLLVQLSVTHIVCIAGALVNTAFLVTAPVLDELTCFQIFALPIAVMLWQSVIMLVISVDLLCAIVIPIIYREWSTRAFVVASLIFCGIMSAAYTTTIYATIRSHEYSVCNAYSVQNDTVGQFVGIVNYIIAIPQVLIYITCYTVMYIRARIFMHKNMNACYRNKHRKTMRTISVLIVIYICTWVLSIVLTNVIGYINNDMWQRWLQMVVCILQMMCFVQTFYVCYQRSSEYRNIFRRLFKSVQFSEDVKDHLKRAFHGEKVSDPTLPDMSGTTLSTPESTPERTELLTRKMRTLLFLVAVGTAVVFCNTGVLDHVSDCVICMNVLVAALTANSAKNTFEYQFNWYCNQTKSYVFMRPDCNRIASEFLASSSLREKFKTRTTLTVREGTYICEHDFPQKYCMDGKFV